MELVLFVLSDKISELSQITDKLDHMITKGKKGYFNSLLNNQYHF
jgi:hypothetical protein